MIGVFVFAGLLAAIARLLRTKTKARAGAPVSDAILTWDAQQSAQSNGMRRHK